MRPNEQKYKNKGAAKKKPKKLKQADEFLFERRMRFFISKCLKFLTIISVIGIISFITYLYKSEKYVLVIQYFDDLTEKFFISQGMRLEQIEVKGNKKTTEAEVLNKVSEVLKNLSSSSLTHLPMEDIKKNIELLGWVKSAEITKLFPNKLIVNIIERTPKAIWQDKAELWLVDEEGNLVTDKIEKEYVKLPVVVSKNPIETIPDLFSVINKHDIFGNNVVSAVRVGNRRWDIYLKSGIIIKLPEKDVDLAIERLMKLQKTKMILDRSIKYVDLRLTDRVAVKKLSEKDFVNEKPPISLSSAYTPTNDNAEPTITEDGKTIPAKTTTPVAATSPTTTPAVATQAPTNIPAAKIGGNRVIPSEEKSAEAPTPIKTESSILSNKNKRPASLTSNQGNTNTPKSHQTTTAAAPKSVEKKQDHNEEGDEFFKKMDVLIGN